MRVTRVTGIEAFERGDYYAQVEPLTCRCGVLLSADEMLNYGSSCEACYARLRVPCVESEVHDPVKDGVVEPIEAEISAAEKVIAGWFDDAPDGYFYERAKDVLLAAREVAVSEGGDAR
jgi:hypothetical protein